MPLRIAAIIVLAFALFFAYLGATSLWDPDEPRQAIMAREMMDRGDYIHPYLNGLPYLEKPPLYPWMIIIAAKLHGSLDEFAARVPSAIMATLLLFVAFFLGKGLLDAQAGFLSAVALALNYQFLSNARESVMDMTFASCIGLTIFLSYVALSRKNKAFFILSFIPAAFAILAKGPAGLLIPAAVMFIYLSVIKEWRRHILPLAVGCLLSCAIASIWFGIAGPEYFKEFILRQNITRYTNAFDHKESVFYYFHKLFFNFLPWSIFLPFALVHAWRRKYWLPLIWFVFTFLFFELSQSKRAIYLLCAYPACAVLCGLFLKNNWEGLVSKSWTGLLLKVFAGLCFILPVAAAVAIPLLPASGSLVALNNNINPLYVYLGLLFIMGLLFLVMLFRKSHTKALSFFVMYLVVAALCHNAYYIPLVDRTSKSLRLITDELEPYKKTHEFYTLGFNSAGIIFYIGKPIHMVLNTEVLKNTKDDNLLLIVEEKRSAGAIKELKGAFQPIKRVKYEKEYYTLYVRKHG